eukprot:CAMPEP_0197046844 /NCGR_PEP_ID=MMETSP1384-20130603/22459_1 /TAXON_ID=29189 /ORGANISM="Ammonia sp." /LENGTH=180 /DNA_ID=CAMNT_0042478687 /DNA_START=40 /DNA_END=579 /DNA_ORIENTATION=+
MTPSIATGQYYYSKFMLALMEDSGWYLPNHAYADPFYFGYQAGCAFLTGQCVDSTTHDSNYPQWWADFSSDRGCHADYSAPALAYYYTYGSDVPTEYQYFANANEGGVSYSNYCPYRAPWNQVAPDYESVCWDLRGNVLDSPSFAETWSLTSRCATIKRTDIASNYGYCFQHTCTGWDGS